MICTKEFISTLSSDECHKLIMEAYNRAGGIEMAKSIIEMPPENPQPQPPRMVYQAGASVEGVDQCPQYPRTSAAGSGLVSPNTLFFTT